MILRVILGEESTCYVSMSGFSEMWLREVCTVEWFVGDSQLG